MYLLSPRLPILMPPYPVCLLPLEMCGSMLWFRSLFSPVGTHTHHTHGCLCVWGARDFMQNMISGSGQSLRALQGLEADE